MAAEPKIAARAACAQFWRRKQADSAGTGTARFHWRQSQHGYELPRRICTFRGRVGFASNGREAYLFLPSVLACLQHWAHAALAVSWLSGLDA